MNRARVLSSFNKQSTNTAKIGLARLHLYCLWHWCMVKTLNTKVSDYDISFDKLHSGVVTIYLGLEKSNYYKLKFAKFEFI